MQGRREFWEGQLRGLKNLPKESGLWGVLLPRGAPTKEESAQAAVDCIETLNPAVLRFDQRDADDMHRGASMALAIFIGLFALITAPAAVLQPAGNQPTRLWVEALVWGIPSVIVVAAIFFARKFARAPLIEPVALCRRERRFHVWGGKDAGWKSWSYDDLTPFIWTGKLVTSAGASTVYSLRLAVVDPVSRRIEESFAPAPMQLTAEACTQIWQFIRVYMHGEPQHLPPVRGRPAWSDKAADLARFDRRFGAAIITPDHRIQRGVFPHLVFWFWAIVEYWQMRAMAWIQRTAPRPAPPPELAQALAWQGTNPYRFVEMTTEERLAHEGRLPRLRWRWGIAGLLSTLLWGTVFATMCYGILSTLWA